MKLIAMLLAVVCLGGCATVTSKSISGNKEGISYYLPKRLHKVSVSVTNLNEDATKLKKAEEKYAKVLVAKDAASQDFKKKEEESKKAEETFKNTPAGPARTKAETERDMALAAFNISKAALGEASAAATDAYEALKKITAPVAGGSTCNYTAKLTVEPQPLVPDSKHGFVANLHHNPFHSDEFKLTTTDAGLLSSTESKSTDNTGDIVGKIVQTLASFGVPVPGLAVTKGVLTQQKAGALPCPEYLDVSAIVDLANPKDLTRLNKRLEAAQLGLEICGQGINPYLNECIQDAENSDELEFGTAQSIVPPGDGLLYRRELPYLVRLWDFNSPLKKVSADALVMMPNLSPITNLTFEPAIFVTNTQKVGFNNGMLVSLETTRPSEALGLVSIPADIAKTYLSMVTQIIKLRVDYSSSETDLAKSQAALLDAIKALNDKKNDQASSRN